MRLYKISGYLSLFFGFLAALSCLDLAYLFAGLICAVLGFIFSILTIFITTKYALPSKVFSAANVGMLMSSVPVVYLLIVIFILKNY
jgi:hypothetical protein